MINKRKIISGIVALSILGIIAFGFNNRVDADAVKIGLGGSTRYETAIETSKNVESQLTSSPIILMEESGTYYPKVLERIKGIKSDQVLALGGTGVVSESIVDKILEAVNYEEKFKVLSIE